MDNKKLIHAVAGSGKTTTILNLLDPKQQNLIITYTENNQNNLRSKIIDKFGYFPDHTFIFGVFKFLYDFCLVPYLGCKPKGINFNYIKKNNYDNNSVDDVGRIVSNQLSRSLLQGNLICNNKTYPIDKSYLERMDKFFDNIFIDECQDFESDDFDWMLTLSQLKAKVLLVGDFYQKNLKTSIRGKKGTGIHSNFSNWKAAFIKAGFTVDQDSLSKSYRCPEAICSFIRDKLNINIFSHEQISEPNNIEIKLIESPDEIKDVIMDDSIIKLFYQSSNKYDCKALNWGASKGLEFSKVCVVLNKTTFELFSKDKLNDMKPLTKSKFYVACTRTQGSLYFVNEASLNMYKL
ncbi:RNA helicase [Atopobacter sp. AH10]|uniref:RNA helicase n=1 Tax=Atopobacter sp. AH10 TaxID=2315861 RepID=UPI000EF21CA4|nr:RNA helicase [Atopobacter sp. AH10]RLK62518.1 RNA helicase [Atopobacter sp. AH10]